MQTELINVDLFVLGPGTAGKTTMIKRLLHNEFYDNSLTTIGIERKNFICDNINFNFLDCGGQKIFLYTHPIFFTENVIYILVWNPYHELMTDGYSRTLEETIINIRNKSKNGKILLVTSHCNNGFETQQTNLDILNEYNFYDYVKIDSLDGTGFDKLKEKLKEMVFNSPNIISKNNYINNCAVSNVINELNNINNENKNNDIMSISLNKLYEIIKLYDINYFDIAKTLHDLRIIFIQKDINNVIIDLYKLNYFIVKAFNLSQFSINSKYEGKLSFIQKNIFFEYFTSNTDIIINILQEFNIIIDFGSDNYFTELCTKSSPSLESATLTCSTDEEVIKSKVNKFLIDNNIDIQSDLRSVLILNFICLTNDFFSTLISNLKNNIIQNTLYRNTFLLHFDYIENNTLHKSYCIVIKIQQTQKIMLIPLYKSYICCNFLLNVINYIITYQVNIKMTSVNFLIDTSTYTNKNIMVIFEQPRIKLDDKLKSFILSTYKKEKYYKNVRNFNQSIYNFNTIYDYNSLWIYFINDQNIIEIYPISPDFTFDFKWYIIWDKKIEITNYSIDINNYNTDLFDITNNYNINLSHKFNILNINLLNDNNLINEIEQYQNENYIEINNKFGRKILIHKDIYQINNIFDMSNEKLSENNTPLLNNNFITVQNLMDLSSINSLKYKVECYSSIEKLCNNKKDILLMYVNRTDKIKNKMLNMTLEALEEDIEQFDIFSDGEKTTFNGEIQKIYENDVNEKLQTTLNLINKILLLEKSKIIKDNSLYSDFLLKHIHDDKFLFYSIVTDEKYFLQISGDLLEIFIYFSILTLLKIYENKTIELYSYNEFLSIIDFLKFKNITYDHIFYIYSNIFITFINKVKELEQEMNNKSIFDRQMYFNLLNFLSETSQDK